MAKRPQGMEPASDIASYDAEPFFRKQWFMWVLILVFIPALIVIALNIGAVERTWKFLLTFASGAGLSSVCASASEPAFLQKTQAFLLWG